MEKPFLSLNSLNFLIKRLAPSLTIGDLKEAANTLTIPFEKVTDYVLGNGYDLVLTTDLIAFFQTRINARNE
jgi:hypothetical protein